MSSQFIVQLDLFNLITELLLSFKSTGQVIE